MLTIKQTTNYSQFKKYSSNRAIDPQRLVKSLRKQNLLAAHPIVVGKDKYVIDGQNRLAAAEILGYPIYYVEDPTLDEQSIPTCQIQKTWELKDFLNFYKRYLDEYNFIQVIQEKFNFPVSFIITVCTKSPKALSLFREGQYKIEKDKSILSIKFYQLNEILQMCKKIHGKYLKQHAFRAIWFIINMENYNHDHFLEKIGMRPQDVLDALKFADTDIVYDRLIENVYNKYNKDKKKT